MKSSSLQIEHQCPQCGAPAVFEETDRLFACQYCKVKSFLASDLFQYLLPHKAPQGKELVYLPYWRFKGMLFSCLSGGQIRHGIVDVSHVAVNCDYFPASVGLRSQTMKLRFVTPETVGYFLNPTLAYQEILGIVEKRYQAGLPKPIYLQSFIGETLSLLYSPVYVDGRLYDAILNKPLPRELPADFDLNGFPGGPAGWRVRFVPAQCPHCGWDMDGERDSIVVTCKNCNSIWQMQNGRFIKLKFACMAAETGQALYLPFWRIKAETTGILLRSNADLIRLANLPKVARKDDEQTAFSFWSPAFKVRPQDFFRFSLNLTLAQPHGKWIRQLPEADTYPVTLPITEAMEGLKVNLAAFMKPPQALLPRLNEINIRAKSFVLIYLPFRIRGNELSNPEFGLHLNRNLLSYARHL